MKEVIKINDNFIMLRNDVVWDVNKLDNTYLKKYSSKALAVIIYLYMRVNPTGMASFSISNLITTCGFKVNSNKGKSLDVFKLILFQLIDNNIISIGETHVAKTKINDYIECKINIELDTKGGLNTNFFKLKYKDIIAIFNSDNIIDNFNIYCYILARIKNRQDDNINKIYITGGKAEVVYDKYETICKDLMISKTKFNKCINELSELDLIVYGNIGLITKDRKVITANNVYATNKYEFEYGLKESQDWYIKNGYKLVKQIRK